MSSMAVSMAAVALAANPPFINPGTPKGIPASYDCTVRQHAWEFGKATLPQRGGFKTLYDALQLQACGVAPPTDVRTESDEWKVPNFPTPTTGKLIFCDAKATAKGDGSKGSPFQTLAEGIAAAKGVSDQVTILLREGTYFSGQNDLTVEFSGLTIQNFEGENAVVSGGLPLSIKKESWKPYKLVPSSWKTYPNENNVYGKAQSKTDTTDVKYVGEFKTFDACVKAAKASSKGPFQSYTWHAPAFGGDFATQCFGTVSSAWAPIPQDNVVSSRFVEAQNTYVTSLEGQNVRTIPGLRVGTERAIRAKYPNGNPELSGQWYFSSNPAMGNGQYTEGWITQDTQWAPPLNQDKKWSETQDIITNGKEWPSVEWPSDEEGHSTWTGEGDWGDYHIGMGGFCDDIDPPTGYWCSKNPPRGQCYNPVKKTSGGCTQTHMAPSGLFYAGVLPQAANYSNPKGAVVNKWRGGGRWFTDLCLVESVDTNTGTLNFSQEVGCNQGGEGEVGGTQWWIENVLEECDSPGEYFYDEEKSLLYYSFNGTAPTGQEQFVATNTKVLFNITGTMKAPVKNIVIRGLTIRDTAYTYLGTTKADVHSMPTGGDWGLQRSGAILIEGSEFVTVDTNLITRIDGNGIFLSNYNRNATISNNELSWIGDSAMASWGSTGTCLNENCTRTIPYTVGPDAREGNQPRGTHVVGNLAREIGIWQKQSSMWFQAATTRTHFERNVHFNGPRAGLNFNDGLGGGDLLEGNLLANCVRESGDHGPFNSWDRIPYITNEGMHRVFDKDNVTGSMPGHVPATGPSVIPTYREIRNNFIFDVYSSQEAIDNDDGSSYYLTHNNYMVYASTGLKSDFGGQWNHHFDNVYAYVANCFGDGNNLAFFGNVCQYTAGYQSTCGTLPTMTVRNNQVYSKDGQTKICPGDTNTTTGVYLDDATLDKKGKDALAPFPMAAPSIFNQQK
eukprot:TRINITY_DN896_c1_g1_i2.p1 TRINITY_DN896_c1_g1~~TRINITY_DN896_c1_g1_i2.p1  ORF type:complete len:953 (+),score=255.36 TRINITY_DN896_c1_g1_i2:56-2914(+)